MDVSITIRRQDIINDVSMITKSAYKILQGQLDLRTTVIEELHLQPTTTSKRFFEQQTVILYSLMLCTTSPESKTLQDAI